MSDPFNPAGIGRHVTDAGLRYELRPGDFDPAGVDFLLGHDLDVWGQAFCVPGGRPAILVELDLAWLELTPGTLGDPSGSTAQWLGAAGDFMPAMLGHRGLYPAPDGGLADVPEAEEIRFVVQLSDRPGRTSGVWGPGQDGTPGGWAVIAPLPPWLPVFDVLLPDFGAQMSLFVTTQTRGLAHAGADALLAGLRREQAAGRLFCARAAVLP